MQKNTIFTTPSSSVQDSASDNGIGVSRGAGLEWSAHENFDLIFMYETISIGDLDDDAFDVPIVYGADSSIFSVSLKYFL